MRWSVENRNFIRASIVLMLMSLSTTRAQTGTTSLYGVVTDKSGASIGDQLPPEVTVRLQPKSREY